MINFLVIEYIFSKSFASKTLVWLHINHAHTCALNTRFGTRDSFSWTLFPEEAATHRLSSPVPGEDWGDVKIDDNEEKKMPPAGSGIAKLIPTWKGNFLPGNFLWRVLKNMSESM